MTCPTITHPILLLVIVIIVTILAAGPLLVLKFYKPPLSEKCGEVDVELLLGSGQRQPLIVAFRDGQGGNT